MFLCKSHQSQIARNANVSRSTSAVSVSNSKVGKSAPRVEGSLRILNILECPNDVLCCQFSVDGRNLAVGLKDGMIKIYNTQSGQARYQLADKDCLMLHLPVTQIRFRALDTERRNDYMNILIASYASGMVKLWHYPTATCVATISEKRQTLSIEVNPDRSKLLTTGSDAFIHVYDLETRKLINTCKASDSQQLMDGHKFRVFAAQYHPATQNTFISGGWDNTVQYWDDRNPRSFRHFTGPHICGDSLAIDASTNQILTGSWRRTNILQ
ncbi:WD repeat-containing protein 38-like, partial [Octopus sinensis]|uniref:WD repeat-containing protein 38-like n=1 Tax=Octopus sinensis TaxID=2607531 RepID=A0A6P7TZV7_9MOLL